MIFTIFYILIGVIFTALNFLAVFILYIFVRPFSKKKSIIISHSFAKFWARGLMKMAFIKFDLENEENYDSKKVYLLTPNHQSAFDIFCCFCIFKGLYAFVSKDTYGKVPMVGLGMKLANYIFVKRGTVGAAKSIEDIAERLNNQTSVVLYPEGTRSKTGEINMPKRGILRVAEKCPDIPILPVVIYGTKDIMKARSFKINPFRKIKVRFLKPFYFKDIEGDENFKLKYWHDIMTKNYNDLKDKDNNE